MVDSDERILKQEELRSRKQLTGKGVLTLTEDDLRFTKKGGLLSKDQCLEVPLADIVNVRAKKAFGAGEDHLEIDYAAESGKTKRLLFSRFSMAQWASTVSGGGGAMGRLEANSLSAWEDAINEARHRSAPDSAGTDLGDLEKLAELRDKGVITEEEFQAKKKQILGL